MYVTFNIQCSSPELPILFIGAGQIFVPPGVDVSPAVSKPHVETGVSKDEGSRLLS
jgi:hypothetical protein